MQQWFLYVLECANASLYSGVTTDVQRRYAQHCAGTAARYTRSWPPKNLLGYRSCESRSEALKAELAIKKLSAGDKRILVASWPAPEVKVDTEMNQ